MDPTTDGTITHRFTKEEAAEMKRAAEEMRRVYERLEQKIDAQNKMIEHLIKRGDWWKSFLRNVVHRFSGMVESELREVE